MLFRFCLMLLLIGLNIGQRVIYLRVFELVVLIQAPLRSICLIAVFYTAFVEPIDFSGCSPHSNCFVMLPVVTANSFLFLPILTLYFIFCQAGLEFIFLFHQVLHLGSECDVSQIKPDILMIVWVIVMEIFCEFQIVHCQLIKIN